MAAFPPALVWLTAPEVVVVNPGPDLSGIEVSFFMIHMFDLAKISLWVTQLQLVTGTGSAPCACGWVANYR